MAEYIEREALLGRMNNFCEINCDYTKKQRSVMCGACGIGDAKIMVEDAIAADVRSVVFCRDCKNAHMTHDGLCKYCDVMIEYGVDDSLYFPGDHFCADGERKIEDGETN